MRRSILPGLVRVAILLTAAVATVTVASRTSVLLPDLVLPVVVAGALLHGPSRGGLLGLAGGWLVDLLPPGAAVLGTSALVYAACGLLAGSGRREGETPWGWVALVGAGAAVVSSAGRIVLALLSDAPVVWAEVGLRLLLSAALCAVALPLLVLGEQSLARRRAA